jgi:hypothetical protein
MGVCDGAARNVSAGVCRFPDTGSPCQGHDAKHWGIANPVPLASMCRPTQICLYRHLRLHIAKGRSLVGVHRHECTHLQVSNEAELARDVASTY